MGTGTGAELPGPDLSHEQDVGTSPVPAQPQQTSEGGSERYCAICGRAANRGARICKGCGSRDLVRHAYLPNGYLPLHNDRLAAAWRRGGTPGVARQNKISLNEAAALLARAGVYGKRIPPQAAAWLVTHPTATCREAAAALGVSAATVSRWKTAMTPSSRSPQGRDGTDVS